MRRSGVELEPVGPHGGVDEPEQCPDDAVLVQRSNSVESMQDPRPDGVHGFHSTGGVGRVELGPEQRNEVGGNCGLFKQRGFHVALAERER